MKFLGSENADTVHPHRCRSTNVGDVLDIDHQRFICMRPQGFIPFYGPSLTDGLPRLVTGAIGRLARGEHLNIATALIEEQATGDEKIAVDAWLQSKHSLTQMIRATPERRFRPLVDMEADTAATSYD